MDNFHIDILAEGEKTLAEAIRIAFRHNAPGQRATHWAIIEHAFRGIEWHERDAPGPTRPTMVFYWSDPSDKRATSTVVELKHGEATVMIQRWLESLKEKGKWPRQPDHDGSNGHGYRVFVEGWGHVHDNHYAIVAVQPTWAMYGK